MRIPRMDQLDGAGWQKRNFSIQSMLQYAVGDKKKFMEIMTMFGKELSGTEYGCLHIVTSAPHGKHVPVQTH